MTNTHTYDLFYIVMFMRFSAFVLASCYASYDSRWQFSKVEGQDESYDDIDARNRPSSSVSYTVS